MLEVELWLVLKWRSVSWSSRIEGCGDEENNVGEDPRENMERGISVARISGWRNCPELYNGRALLVVFLGEHAMVQSLVFLCNFQNMWKMLMTIILSKGNK